MRAALLFLAAAAAVLATPAPQATGVTGVSAESAVTLDPSLDGTCGKAANLTCWGSFYGNCCGSNNKCGTTADVCGKGCQKNFGYCSGAQLPLDATDATESSLEERAVDEIFEAAGLEKKAVCNADNLQRCFNPSGSAKAAVSSRSAATSYCSSYLGLGVVTSTVATTTSTTTASTVAVTTLAKRQATSSAVPPVCLKQGTSYPASRVSSACSCLSIKSSTTSVTATATATATSTSTSTFTTCKTPTATPSCVPCAGQSGTPATFCGADINTNYYDFVPNTCRTVYYDFDVTNTTMAPDGIERIVLSINGQVPGPLIEANWGDTVVVRLNNKLQNNGTSFHFHGIRQNHTVLDDGVPSITQCPIAPGQSMNYTWRATNYGTSWYHSHFAIQAWEGVFGPVIIHGPHSADYDVDVGVVTLGDWSHATVDSMYDAAQAFPSGGPRVLDNGLINGKNTWTLADGSTVGERYTLPTEFEAGKTYLIRLVNTAMQSTYKFYIDGHKMTVISNDFVPIVPYETDILNINIGQRYNVLVTADQTPGSYWMRSDNQNACAGTIQALDIKAIINYAGVTPTTPTSTAYNYTGECVDEPYASLVPVVKLNAGEDDKSLTEQVTVGPNADSTLFKWYLSGTTFMSFWGEPTLLGIQENGTAPTFSGDLLIPAPNKGDWIYIVIESGIPLPHPIHLHGHDFHVIAQGKGSYDPASSPTTLVNPPRRDTTLLPGAGYVVIAFIVDNPGVWLMHCHIGWHTSMGLALQVVEMQDQIAATLDDTCKLQNTCSAWDAYALANNIQAIDSGV